VRLRIDGVRADVQLKKRPKAGGRMSGVYVEIILLPGGEVEQYADPPTFEEAVSWLDARNPNENGRRGRFFGIATNEQIRILNEKGYGPY
jgi:hypothetical protein